MFGSSVAALRSVFIRSGIIVQHRRAGPYRLDGVGDVGQRFVLNVNQVHRFFGDLSAVRRHRCDRFANVAHPLSRQQGHVFHSQANHHRRYVGASDNCADARQLLGL